MGLFQNRKQINGKTQVPVWFMRQAGRYHDHYQNIRRQYGFMQMCKQPELAVEITMGPIRDFDFDAAILFSDLLFPLEQLNLGLSYEMGPPTLEKKLDSVELIRSLQPSEAAESFYHFQADALRELRQTLSQDKSLLGFVGAPFTLYTYACEGSHSGNLSSSKLGLRDGRYQAFLEKLLPELLQNMIIQANANADAICLFDTAAGELTPKDFATYIVPIIRQLSCDFKKACPDTRLVYYSKMTQLAHLQTIEDQNIDVLGVDWRHDMALSLDQLGKDYMIQGNLDPSHLFLPWKNLQDELRYLWNRVCASKTSPDRWIMGLGHGVLPGTPQNNVADTVKFVHENFLY